jgi:hypothetical protein
MCGKKDYGSKTAEGDGFWGIPRDADAIPCECGGFADALSDKEADFNMDELRKFGCGCEIMFGYNCCVRAFKCRICGKRIIGRADAPKSF